MTIIYLLLLSLIPQALPKEVILSSGIMAWNQPQLHSQYTAFKTYADIGIINTSSILTYLINPNGSLGVYQTNVSGISGEDYQHYIKTTLKLRATPCIFCDATIGMCSDLGARLRQLFAKETEFIEDSVQRAKKYGWDGYMVDFEPDTPVDADRLTNFLVKWGSVLHAHGMDLSVWIGGPTQYNLEILYNTSSVNLITMSTYWSTYPGFVAIAGQLQTQVVDISKLGFGLITYDNVPGYDPHALIKYPLPAQTSVIDSGNVTQIAKWLVMAKAQILSLWVSLIPPDWYEGLLWYMQH